MKSSLAPVRALPLSALALAAALSLAACKQPAAPDAAQPSATAPAASGQAAPTQAAPAGTAPGEASPVEAAPSAAVGDTPELRIVTLDGKTYDLAEHRGKWVVVNFWATWCAPCIKEMPELSALDAMREHIEVIGLAYEEIDKADMQAFLKQHPVSYPIAVLDVTDPPKSFDTPKGLPMTYLIGPDGKVVEKFLGPVDAKKLEDAIAKAGGPKPGEPAGKGGAGKDGPSNGGSSKGGPSGGNT
ncbi:TlpA family protein disulfide reductase [Lysobacter enzymogenes]|uniref:TlpA family protein disulfide reductase n=1 Tax=Lysobacter enzymogenes TaxID=69 RepID=A0A3N2RIG5_LYSEN|nr:TlpA family protein disulfide reductase [Lysobacter enzymogenes]